jgi:hypothetical protein
MLINTSLQKTSHNSRKKINWEVQTHQSSSNIRGGKHNLSDQFEQERARTTNNAEIYPKTLTKKSNNRRKETNLKQK